MINKNSINAVDNSLFDQKFRSPLYSSYCFSKIPDTVKTLLGTSGKDPLPKDCYPAGERYEDVIVLFVDGFGWKFFEKSAASDPFLQRIVGEGVASKITSQFPSTTACHVTTMNTGLPVSQTGIYEWFYYEPVVDDIIASFLFSFAGDKKTESLRKANILPEQVYPFTTFYQDLSKENVASYIFSHESIIDSTYSKTLLKGAKSVSYSSLEDGLHKLSNELMQPSSQRRYFYLYIEEIDSAGHRNGTYSPEFQNAIDYVLTHLESWALRAKGKLPRKTALLVTADHGMIDIDPKTTIYLNEEFPVCKDYLAKNKNGKFLVPAGSSRDFFFHARSELIDEAKEKLQEFLGSKAVVYKTQKLIEEGIFGKMPIGARLLERLGNLVILPLDHYSVWWHEKDRFAQHFYAMHGGLSPQEMDTIFLFWEC